MVKRQFKLYNNVAAMGGAKKSNMKYWRAFINHHGYSKADNGETPADQIFKMEKCWIEGDDGRLEMTDSEASREVVKAMVSLLRGPKVLEVGYGMGFSFEEIRKRFPSHDVIDIDAGAYQLGQVHWPSRYDNKGQRYVGDYRSTLVSVPEEYYDSIYIDATLDLFADEASLAPLRRILKTGGYLVPLPMGYPKSDRELRSLLGFRRTKVAPYRGCEENEKEQRHNLRLLLQRKKEMNRFESLMKTWNKKYLYEGVVGRYVKQ